MEDFDLNKVRDNVKKMIDAGAPKEDIERYLQGSGVKEGQGMMEQPEPTQPVLRQAPESAKWATPARDVLAKYGRPVAETLIPAAMIAAAPAELPLLAVVGLGALGYAGVKTALDMVDEKLGEAEVSEPKTIEEASAKQQFVQGLNNFKEGLMFEMLGRGVGEGVGKLGKAFVRKPKTPIEEVAQELHQRLTRHEVSGKRSTQLIEAALEAAPTSTDVMAEFRFQNQLRPLMEERARLLSSETTSDKQLFEIGKKIHASVTNYLTMVENVKGSQLEGIRAEILATLGGNHDFESVGAFGQEALAVAEKAMRDRAKLLYLKVGENFKVGQDIPTPHLNEKAEELLTKRLKLPSQESAYLTRLRWAATKQGDRAEDIVKILEERSLELSGEERQALMMKLNELAPADPSKTKDWFTLVAFDQDLRALIDSADQLGGKGANIKQLNSIAREYTKLKKALELDMEEAAMRVGDDAWTNYEIAKNFYREEIGEVFRTKQIQRLYQVAPDEVVAEAFKSRSVSRMKLLKKSLASQPGAFEQLRTGFMDQIMDEVLDPVSSQFDPKKLKRILKKQGEPFWVEAFGKDGYDSLQIAADRGLSVLLSEPIGEAYLKSITKPDVIDPSFIVDNIIGTTKTLTDARRLRKNLTLLKTIVPKETMDELGNLYLERVFKTETATGFVDPVRLSQALFENEKVLKTWFPKENYRKMMKLAELGAKQKGSSRLARDIGEKQTIATWTTTGVALRSVTSGSLTSRIAAPVITLGPKLLSKLYVSEGGIRFLEQASTMPVTSAKAAEVVTKILTIVNGTPFPGGIEGSVPKLKKERVKRRFAAPSVM